MKTIVYYDCLCSIVLLIFHYGQWHTLPCPHGGKYQGADVNIGYPPPHEKFGGYAYNDVNTLLTQIERVLKRQLYKDSANRMKVLASNIRNALNEYRSTIHIKNRYLIASSRAAADLVSTDDSTVELEITNNSDAQD